MSNKLIIKKPYNQNAASNISTNNTPIEEEWADDIGGFWDDDVPEIISQPDAMPEPISTDEIIHIKVFTYIRTATNLICYMFNQLPLNYLNRKMTILY